MSRLTLPPVSDSRTSTAAAASQGRGSAAAAPAASLDGPSSGGGYTEANGNSARTLDFAWVRAQVPLVAILAHYHVLETLKPFGNQLRGACPIHKGTHKRQFFVRPSTNSWRCFSTCQRGGGTLEFVAEMEHLSTLEAARRIAQVFALTPSHQPRSTAMSDVSNRPTHKVFCVDERAADREDAFWTRIGSAWEHKDGKGLSIQLNALPINARLVLREIAEGDRDDAPKSGQVRHD